ncbi:unnamed protein product [Caenorhabditis nigoni]
MYPAIRQFLCKYALMQSSEHQHNGFSANFDFSFLTPNHGASSLAAPAENPDPPAQNEPQEEEEEFEQVIMTFYAPDTSNEPPENPPVTARFATLPEP